MGDTLTGEQNILSSFEIDNEQFDKWAEELAYGSFATIPDEILHNKMFWLHLRNWQDGLGAAYMCREFYLIPSDVFTQKEQKEFWQNVDFIYRLRNYQNIPEGLFSDQEIVAHWFEAYDHDSGEVTSSFTKIPKIALDAFEQKGILKTKSKKIIRDDGSELFVDELINEDGQMFGTKDIRLAIDRSGKSISFASLIASNYKFISMEQDRQSIPESIGDHEPWSTDSRKKTILFGDLTKAGALLSLLHEAGHSFQQEDADKLEELEFQIKLYETRADQKKLNELAKEYEAIWARTERNAWAYALKKTRAIKRNLGFNLEPNLKSREDINDIIGTCLTAYDNGFELRFGKRSTVFTRGKLKPSDTVREDIKKEVQSYIDQEYSR